MAREIHGTRSDRRRYPRFPVPACEVYYDTPLLPVLLRAPKGAKCPLVNMSAGGLQFIADGYLPPGKKLSLFVRVPAFLGSMTFRARVVWTAKVPEKKAYRTGVEFIRMNGASRSKLSNLRRDITFRTGGKK